MCGIKSKLLSNDFEKFIDNFDILCVTETKLAATDVIDIPSFEIYSNIRVNALNSSGGVSFLVRKTLSQYCREYDPIDNNDYSIWLRFDNNEHEIYLCGVYIAPEGSLYSDINMFDVLEHEYIMNNPYGVATIFIGDFNARTKSLNSNIELRYDEILCSSGHLDSHSRNSTDNVLNNYGKRLLDLCESLNMTIVNGCKYPDIPGQPTCQNTSVIDYIICSSSVFEDIEACSVLTFEPLFSDKHSVVTANINISKVAEIDVPSITADSDHLLRQPSVKWASSKKNDFVHRIDKEELSAVFSELDAVTVESINVNEIDGILDRLGNIYKVSAKDCGMIRNCSATNKARNHTNADKPWFDHECALYRTKYFAARKVFAICKTHENMKLLQSASKNYSKKLVCARTSYLANVNAKLRNLRSKNQKSYWKILNEAGNSKYESADVNMISEFYNHFKTLNCAMEGSEQLASDILDISPVNDNPVSSDEIIYCIKKLRNNKACGTDGILNEFLKATEAIFLPTFVKLFNLIIDSGIFPSAWNIGVIKPIYKKKGPRNDVDNYRGITLVSCLGKLFTGVINERFENFLENNKLLGCEQAGFRKNLGTVDHIFSLKTVIDFYLHNKKRLYCCFVDYKKAFDSVDRATLFRKLINLQVDNRIVRLVVNMYKDAKSRVKVGNFVTDTFDCNVGLRQGEIMSPLLFAVYLNDLKAFLADNNSGLNYMKDFVNLHMGEDEVDILCQLFVLLYADDTVVLAESANNLNVSLSKLNEYCERNFLSINVDKTKVVIFSRGVVRVYPQFVLGDNRIDVVNSYKYLGVVFYCNGNFGLAVKTLCTTASNAMFAILSKMSVLNLDVDTMIHLFESMVKPILLYGAEIWGCAPEYVLNQIERVQLKFCKILLSLRKRTPSDMVYGETGVYPLIIDVKIRATAFWLKLAQSNENTLANAFLKLRHKFENPWLNFVKSTLDSCGLSYLWMTNGRGVNPEWLKYKLRLSLRDQFFQQWSSRLSTCEKFSIYNELKEFYCLEDYLIKLPKRCRDAMCKFRCRNVNLPVVSTVSFEIQANANCKLCSGNIGDELHYIFYCQRLKNSREKLIPQYYRHYPSMEKFKSLFKMSSRIHLIDLCKFLEIVSSELKRT